MTITINFKGRLGNQLFQYAILRSIAIKNNYDYAIYTNFIQQNQLCLLKNLNIDPTKINSYAKYKRVLTERDNNNRTFDPNFCNILDNSVLNGYFENYNYFKDISNILVNELKPNKDICDWGDKFIEQYTQPIVCIHIRRNHQDYISLENDELSSNKLLFIHKIAEEIEQNEKNITYLVFSGGSTTDNNDNDKEWLAANIKLENKEIINNNNILKEFYLMSLCNYNILSSSSTFAWWAAFIGKNNYGNVYIDKKNNVWNTWECECEKFKYIK